MESDIYTSFVYGRILLYLMVIALLSIPAGVTKEFTATQTSPDTVVIGSTTFTLTEDTLQCLDELKREQQIKHVWNAGVFMTNCIKKQKTTTAVPGQPTFSESMPPFIRASEGDTVVLPCAVIDREEHSMQWIKRGTNGGGTTVLFLINGSTGLVMSPVPLVGIYQEFNMTSSVFNIRIEDVMRDDAGIYECQISTMSTNTNAENHKLIHLEVHIPVTITTIGPWTRPYFNSSEPNTRFFNETETANVTCYTDGTAPIDIFWIPQPLGCITCQNCVIPKGYKPPTNRKVYIYNRSLIIPNVSRANSTCYMVKAENKDAPNVWELVQLKIQFKPRVQAVNNDVRGGPRGYVSLKCTVEAFPAAKIVWKNSSGNIIETDDNLYENGLSQKVFVSLTTREYGNYTCEATNLLGSTSAQLEISGRPLAPVITSALTSTRKHAYELCWERAKAEDDSNINTIPITKYVAEYLGEWIARKKGAMRVVYSHDTPLHVEKLVLYEQKDYCETLRDLRPNTTYTIWLYGENKWGRGNKANITIQTVSEDITTTTVAITQSSNTTINPPDRRVFGSRSFATKSATSFACILLLVLPVICRFIWT